MTTSRQPTSPCGKDRSTYLREAFPASHSPQPGEGRERQTTVTSGLKCFESSGRYSPLSSLLKTLMESSRWYNPAVRLMWTVRPLSSVRVTTFTAPSKDTSPTSCAKTSKRRDMLSSRSLFRLAVSARPIADTACGSSPNGATATILPTPVTQGLKVCENGRQLFMPLNLLPTPLSVEISHTKRIIQLKEKGGKTMGSRVNGESRPNGLMDYLHFHSLLPTPNAAEGTNWTRTYNPDSQMGRGLTALAVNGLLLSPMSKDEFRAGLTMQALKNHNRPKANLAEQIAHKVGGGTSQLSPLFVTEMMGFPLEYLVLPFLSEDGEKMP
nr:MAG TPA: hypothetical protein [Caudoviricetes sp.]